MKFSVNWLKQWVRVDLDAAELARRLTAAGLEVDSMTPVAGPFDGVVIASIEACVPHADASKLSVCTVDDGSGSRLQVVCGAPNARAGLRAPLARVGACLGPGATIRAARLRGVESAGMLCSARELGLSDDHSGLLELPADAPVGADLRGWMGLDDTVIEVDLTPNRADCLSIRGLARDVAASCNAQFLDRTIPAIPAATDLRRSITLENSKDCARYAGRIIDGIDARAETPLWMRESLRRCGVRSIHPVVDVTNFVMLELGQPMHAFDLDRLQGGITVRRGHTGEELVLLDGSRVSLDSAALAICDERGPVALAGIMGGFDSGVTPATTAILLESARFAPAIIMGRARALGLHSDASHRFERGVDPALQVTAIERATELLLAITGGSPGPVLLAEDPQALPRPQPITLRAARLASLAGMPYAAAEVERILVQLGMQCAPVAGGWTVVPPSARVDVSIEADLIEEVARIHGYDHIPERPPGGQVAVGNAASHDVSEDRLREALCAAGFQEAVTYSFVDRTLLEMFGQARHALPLANPLSNDMDVMRTALVPGLVRALQYNLRRQRTRVRLFELGTVFHQADELIEFQRVAAVATGNALPENWSDPARELDFFDVKGEVERLLSLGGRRCVEFRPGTAPFAHPGASAEVYLEGVYVGWCGALHPGVLKQLDIGQGVQALELDAQSVLRREIPLAGPISRFPSIRRDLAFWIPGATAYDAVRRCVVDEAGDLLQNLVVFDVYYDEELKKGYKSLAIGLILQNVSSTLTDEDVEPVMQRVVAGLQHRLGARLRG